MLWPTDFIGTDLNINKHVNSQSASMQDSHQSKAVSHGNKKKKPMLFKILHMGTWAGLFSKILYAIAALIGGFLPVSGYYMWWKRNHKSMRSYLSLYMSGNL